MVTEKLKNEIEFLLVFFSFPGKELFQEIYSGNTPLGNVTENLTFDEFHDNLSSAVTDLFINSPNAKPIYPLLSRYLDDESNIETMRQELGELYDKYGKRVVGFPPDHITPLLEHLLMLFGIDDIKLGSEFYNSYIKKLTEGLSKDILKRSTSECVEKIGLLLQQINTSFEKMVLV